MNSVILSYDNLWVYYNQAEKYIQDDILKQLDLENYLPRVGVDVRAEVMRSAPKEIKERIARVIPMTRADEEYHKFVYQMLGVKRT